MAKGNPNGPDKKMNGTLKIFDPVDKVYKPAYIAPDATDTVYGDVLLSDATNGTEDAATGVTAATPKAVKEVNDNAETKLSKTNALPQEVAGKVTFKSQITADQGIKGDLTGNADTASALKNDRTIEVTLGDHPDAENAIYSAGKVQFDGSKDVSINIPDIPAEKLVGEAPLNVIPKAALERLYNVADEATRFALTTNEVQLGDTVYQNDTQTMYLVVDENKLDSDAGYQEYKAGSAVTAMNLGTSDIGHDGKVWGLNKGTPAEFNDLNIGSEDKPVYIKDGVFTPIDEIKAGVSGVKGDYEKEYRKGDVNLTYKDIPAIGIEHQTEGITESTPDYGMQAGFELINWPVVETVITEYNPMEIDIIEEVPQFPIDINPYLVDIDHPNSQRAKYIMIPLKNYIMPDIMNYPKPELLYFKVRLHQSVEDKWYEFYTPARTFSQNDNKIWPSWSGSYPELISTRTQDLNCNYVFLDPYEVAEETGFDFTFFDIFEIWSVNSAEQGYYCDGGIILPGVKQLSFTQKELVPDTLHTETSYQNNSKTSYDYLIPSDKFITIYWLDFDFYQTTKNSIWDQYFDGKISTILDEAGQSTGNVNIIDCIVKNDKLYQKLFTNITLDNAADFTIDVEFISLISEYQEVPSFSGQLVCESGMSYWLYPLEEIRDWLLSLGQENGSYKFQEDYRYQWYYAKLNNLSPYYTELNKKYYLEYYGENIDPFIKEYVDDNSMKCNFYINMQVYNREEANSSQLFADLRGNKLSIIDFCTSCRVSFLLRDRVAAPRVLTFTKASDSNYNLLFTPKINGYNEYQVDNNNKYTLYKDKNVWTSPPIFFTTSVQSPDFELKVIPAGEYIGYNDTIPTENAGITKGAVEFTCEAGETGLIWVQPTENNWWDGAAYCWEAFENAAAGAYEVMVMSSTQDSENDTSDLIYHILVGSDILKAEYPDAARETILAKLKTFKEGYDAEYINDISYPSSYLVQNYLSNDQKIVVRHVASENDTLEPTKVYYPANTYNIISFKVGAPLIDSSATYQELDKDILWNLTIDGKKAERAMMLGHSTFEIYWNDKNHPQYDQHFLGYFYEISGDGGGLYNSDKVRVPSAGDDYSEAYAIITPIPIGSQDQPSYFLKEKCPVRFEDGHFIIDIDIVSSSPVYAEFRCFYADSSNNFTISNLYGAKAKISQNGKERILVFPQVNDNQNELWIKKRFANDIPNNSEPWHIELIDTNPDGSYHSTEEYRHLYGNLYKKDYIPEITDNIILDAINWDLIPYKIYTNTLNTRNIADVTSPLQLKFNTAWPKKGLWYNLQNIPWQLIINGNPHHSLEQGVINNTYTWTLSAADTTEGFNNFDSIQLNSITDNLTARECWGMCIPTYYMAGHTPTTSLAHIEYKLPYADIDSEFWYALVPHKEDGLPVLLNETLATSNSASLGTAKYPYNEVHAAYFRGVADAVNQIIQLTGVVHSDPVSLAQAVNGGIIPINTSMASTTNTKTGVITVSSSAPSDTESLIWIKS